MGQERIDLVAELPCWCCGSTHQLRTPLGTVYCYDCLAEPRVISTPLTMTDRHDRV